MRTQAFKADVESYKYGIKPYTTKSGEELTMYYVTLSVLEVKRGASKKKFYHKGILFLTEDQYNFKEIEKGDRLLIGDNVQWESRKYEYRSYDKKVIEEKAKDDLEKRHIKEDTNGKKYWETVDTAYSFKGQIGDITIFEKHDEVAYWTFNKIKFFMPQIEAQQLFLTSDNYYSRYIYPEDFEDYDYTINTLKKLHGEEVTAAFYLHKNLKKKEVVRCLVGYDSEVKAYFINLVKENEDE